MKTSKAAAKSYGVMRSSMGQLLGAILLLIIGFPFFDTLPFVQALLFSFVYLMALLAVGGQRKVLVWGAVLFTPALLARWSNALVSGMVSEPVILVLAILLFGYVIVHLFSYIVNAPRVTSEVLCAGIATYLMLGLLWALSYVLVSELSPSAFALSSNNNPQGSLDFHSALYFSFITFATVGYGDIVPRLPVARMLAFSQAITGVFYMAVLVARLVAQYSSERQLISRDRS